MVLPQHCLQHQGPCILNYRMQSFLKNFSKQTYGYGACALSNNRQSHYDPQTHVIGALTQLPGLRDCAEAWSGLTCHSQAALDLNFHKKTKWAEDMFLWEKEEDSWCRVMTVETGVGREYSGIQKAGTGSKGAAASIDICWASSGPPCWQLWCLRHLTQLPFNNSQPKLLPLQPPAALLWEAGACTDQ